MTVIKSVTIGRGDDCDLRINDDPYVSPRHVRIDQHASGEFTIHDLGSTNGTFVKRADLPGFGKVPLGSFGLLMPGDTIRVGRTEMPWNGVQS